MQRLINKIVGDWNQKTLKNFWPLVDKINMLDAERDSLGDADIQAKTAEFKARIASGATADELLVEAFATVKQACKRMCGLELEVK
jgi:preprotein translocase subunit SecA